MQDEVNDKTVALVVRASKFTANTLYKATKAYVDHQIKKEADTEEMLEDIALAKRLRIAATTLEGILSMRKAMAHEEGKQSVKDLLKAGVSTDKIELPDGSAKDFCKLAKKFGVDCAIRNITDQEGDEVHFVENKENVIFVGTSGVGKTHLATALGICCTKARFQTYFITFENLITQLKKAYQENRLESRLKFFSKYKVLIIDEIGYMPIDSDTANIFFQLIAKRYEKNSTIITTNMPFSKWGEFFGSATLANAVLDRLLHHSEVISIKGPSYRIKDKRLVLEAQAAEE